MRNILAATAISSLLALNGAAFAQDAAPLTGSSVIATVNGTEILLGHVIAMRQQLPEEYRNLADDVLFEGILNQLVEQSLLASIVDGDSLPLEVRLSMENELRAQLAAVHLDTIISRDIEDTEIEALYAVATAEMLPTPEYNASHILVETEEEALALIVEIESGKDFAEIAQEKSTGPSGPNGGDLGWFGLGQMVPEFENAVTSLAIGDVSAPVQTQFGWHVVKLDDHRETPIPSLDQLRPQLMDQLRQQAVENEIADLTAAGDIMRVEGIDPTIMRDISLLAE